MNTMRLLHVDDSQRDHELALRVVEHNGYDIDSLRVDTLETLVNALGERTWDVILVDYDLPRFDAFDVLGAVGLHAEDVPAIVLSGTVGEEVAVELLKAGAADYVMKDNLTRLVPAIERAIDDAGNRRARRDAEIALRDRECMLAAAHRVMRMGSWRQDLRTGKLTLSEEFASIIGRDRGELESLTLEQVFDLVPPEDRKLFVESAIAVRTKGTPQRFEYQFPRPDGEHVWLDIHIEAELDPDGQPIGVIGAMLDVTDRKEAEQEIRFQAHLLATVEQAVIACDLEGRITYWNDFAGELFGWTADEITGKSFMEAVIPEESIDEVAAVWKQVQSGESWLGELLLRRKDGSQFWAYVHDTPIHDQDGQLIGVLAIAMDITERKEAEETLRQSELKYRMLLEQAADGIIVANEDRKIITVNSRACEMFGYDVDEFLGRDVFDFYHPEEIDRRPPQVSAVLHGSNVTNERRLRRQDGSYFPAETSTRRLDDGRLQIIVRDITDRLRVRNALRRSEREYRSVFENASDAMLIFDPEREIVLDANPRACELYSMPHDEFVGRRLDAVFKGSELEEMASEIAVLSGKMETHETVLYRADGSALHLLVSAAAVEFQGRQCVLSIQRDVSRQKMLEDQLRHLALHDALTGLPNRTLFQDRLAHALALARINQSDVAVMILDLDRFKLINESLGHDVGDRLLLEVAERLQECARDGDTVARPGGDEFTILLDDVTNFHEVTLAAERINNALKMPFNLGDHDIVVTTSLGIAIAEGGDGTPEDLLRSADVAMYRAKDAGRNQYVLFEPSMNERMLERLKLEADLRRAIEREELRVYFQPTVELATRKVVGLEALVRWMHPEQGLVPPGEFIPLAEEAGLIRAIDHFVLNAACRQVAQWMKRYPEQRQIELNVNLSAQGFQHPDVTTDISNAVIAAGLDPTALQLEITESVIMTDVAATNTRLRHLKRLGLRLAIDDFGTGYSSLSYLKRFPVDTLKIDKSFIDGLGTDVEDTAIVKAVVLLARSLGLQVVAEGVEDREACDLLQEIGCELGQGYYFSRPLSVESLDELWANNLQFDADEREPAALEAPCS